METRELLNRIIKILTNPVFGWVKYQPSQFRFKDVLSPFFYVTVIAMFLARFIGKTLSYLSVAEFVDIILYSSVMLVLDVAFFFLSVLALTALMPYFNIKAGKAKVSFLIFISLIPFYASTIIINLFPGLFFLVVISAYSVFILYWGIKYFLKPVKQEAIMIFIVFFLIITGIYLVLNFALVYPFFDFIF